MQFYVTKYYFLHKKTAIIKIAVLHSWLIKQIYKRSSVFDNHLSRLIVTNKLERPTYRRMRATSLMPYLGLAPGGVYTAQLVTQLTVSSYLAFSSLPSKLGGYFLLHCPQDHSHQALPSTLLYGAPTFLTQLTLPAIIWST